MKILETEFLEKNNTNGADSSVLHFNQSYLCFSEKFR